MIAIVFRTIRDRWKMLVTIGIGLAALLGLVLFYWQTKPPVESSLSSNTSSVLRAPQWLNLINTYPGGISLRTDEPGRLLLKHNGADSVYQYDAQTKQFGVATIDAWQNAAGQIEDCNLQIGPALHQLGIDEQRKLLNGTQKVSGIKGKVHLKYQFSPAGDKVAILSANGPAFRSILPALGSGGSAGTHYHQVFSFPSLTPIDAALPLPFISKDNAYSSCWSADAKYVVYSDPLQFNLVIVRE